MNKGLLAIAFLLITLGLGLIFLNTGTEKASESTREESVEVKQTPSLKASQVIENNGVSVLSYRDSSGSNKELKLDEDQKSFVQLTKSFLEFADSRKGPEDFVRFLQELNLRPLVSKDEQELIEDLTVIRTEGSLPGTRYIHAQFDGDDRQELQHLSFEIKKGDQAFEQAIELAAATLGLGERVKNTDPSMAIYRHNGYVIWLKKLSWEDMMGDPFNAYDKSDVGNVRVAIERDIHPHESEHGHEH